MPNRLIHEKSPYLLQHANNPVDWYPWGDEAFEVAQKENKPVFLSIGYATCHWCHVMEKESFEDPHIAQLMNETFVNVKVDREELPAVDNVYMEFAQALMSSAGGWPLNLVLTATRKPFFAMTYLPPVTKKGLISMPQFIEHMRNLWASDKREQMMAQADQIVEIFEKMDTAVGKDLPTAETLQGAAMLLYEFLDPLWGGLKGEPKFPMSYQSLFLLHYTAMTGDSRALFCAELTLEKMHQGGIYDHLGGGFSRYTVDGQWMIPHFEKMLYDNALLARTYLEAWKLTKKEKYRQVCEETLQYILREMTHPEGGFYSAEDADSDDCEGLYYTWTPYEIKEVLSPSDAEAFCTSFGVTEEGNFEGRSVLHRTQSDFSDTTLAPFKAQLLKKRELRIHPFKDDKIITSWNGLAIDALVKAGSGCGKEEYTRAAIKAAEFLLKTNWKDGQLFRRWRDNETRFAGEIDDHAFLIKGLLSLFDEGAGSSWLRWAIELADVLDKKFKSEGVGFYYSSDASSLLLRKCEFYDGAEPSGNAVHAENALRLYQISQDAKYLKTAEEILKTAKLYIETYPPGACYHLIALNRYVDPKAITLVIALDEERSLETKIKSWLSALNRSHIQPVWKRHDDTLLPSLLPSVVDKKPLDGQTAVYICRQNRCDAPLILESEIFQALHHL